MERYTRRLPFKKFVMAFLVAGESLGSIVDKLKRFELNAEESDLTPVLNELKNSLPQNLKEKIDRREPLSPSDENHAQWLKKLDIFEFYDFAIRRKEEGIERPEYFKWFENCLWILAYKDIMSLINIFLFNNEDPESISAIISFKYKKKIGIEAISCYKDTFWDTGAMTAKDALYYCVPFRNDTLIIRKIRSGTEIWKLNNEDAEVSDDGSDVGAIFHDSNYIKWKIGYREFDIPKPQDFLQKVMKDSFFKYYESMNMIQSIEAETEVGFNEKLGDHHSTRRRKRNVEEQKAKMAKHWLDLFLKANKYHKDEGGGKTDKDFFEKMRDLTMEFDEEKLMTIDDDENILDDIRKDME